MMEQNDTKITSNEKAAVMQITCHYLEKYYTIGIITTMFHY